MMKNLVIVRGGGDIASGTIYKLYKAGFPVLILETEKPSAIRRNVAFSEAVYNGSHTIEGVSCILAKDLQEAKRLLQEGQLTMLVDPEGTVISALKPLAVVDGILAKRNLGTRKDMAPITIALGPGFEAGVDVDAVIETQRGHHLGRIYDEGCAIANTGVPGIIGGYGKERVIHSPGEGILRNIKQITDTVSAGDVIAEILPWGDESADVISVKASIDGILRGLIRDGYPVTIGFKIADIDPRLEQLENCFTISDKARCIAGGVLECILHLMTEGDLR